MLTFYADFDWPLFVVFSIELLLIKDPADVALLLFFCHYNYSIDSTIAMG